MSDTAGVLVLFEQMNGKFDAILEYVRDIPEIMQRVTTLEGKTDQLQTDMTMVKRIVKDHSKDIGEVKEIVKIHSSDIAEIKADFAGMKTDIVEVKTDIVEMKLDLSVIKGLVRWPPNRDAPR